MSTTTSQFHGILPAVVTPLDAGERFASASFESLLERVYAAGVDGIYVCGQTGEGLQQPVEQRKRVAEVAVRCSPAGKQVIVHVGAHRTADAVDLARHAAAAGACAVSSLPPAGSYSFVEIVNYYRTLAAASDLPLLVYFFPDVCPSISRVDQILELCAIPNVVGLKFTDFDLYRLSLIKQSGAVIFNGRDEVLAAGLLMGADGGIGTFYNLIPELFLKVYACARAGRWEECRPVQKRINELIEIGLRFPTLAAVKTMLTWSGIACGPCVAPRRNLTPAEEEGLRKALAASSFADAPFAAPPSR
jgi:N-acetylneuraminate lyase